MSSIFPLDLFPTGALSSSVITTVWVGVFVVVYLNLRLGTTLSGLVVPGYLVPLLILRPMSASVIVAEGLITYLIAHLLAERLPKRLSYAEVFGRDRFFALILISIAVRLLFDGLLLPELGEYLAGQGIEYDYRNNLHSFGLIIVALIANQMWNGGIRQGATALFLYVGLSYIIIKFVLMEFTNFNISTLSYMYEDLASSILASPKAYIILLISAFIASRMNLKYGWEFNGILIPSLLALQWYQPEKLLITLIEAVIIYLAAAGLLRLNFFKQLNIEGPRQILLFFNISFVYKMALGYFLITFLPNQKVSDYYAFGYLLSTLLALKMYQKDIAIRIARATLQTSLVGVIAASVIGFMLTLLPSSSAENKLSASGTASMVILNADLEQYINKQRVGLYASQRNALSGQATPLEMDRLNQLFLDIKAYLYNRNDTLLSQISQQCQALGLKVTHLNQHYLIIQDSLSDRGWGLFVFDTSTDSELAIEVPAPLDEIQSADAGASLFRNLSAQSLALAGKKRKQAADGTSDSLKNPQTAFQLFHRHFGVQNALQVRQYTRQTSRRLLGVRDENAPPVLNLNTSQLWVKRSLPAGLNVNLLDKMVGSIDIQWQPAPLENRQQDSSPRGFAELFLSTASIRNILAFSSAAPSFAEKNQSQRIDGYLLSWINQNKSLIAARGSNSYVPANVSEMLFLDQNVIAPIMQMLEGTLAPGWEDSIKPEVQRINDLALALNYQLLVYRHQSSGENFLILQENNTGPMRFWGTYVFRMGEAASYMIEVPRPLAESNTLGFGANLFERLDAKVLLIAGTHPYANMDGKSNLLHNANKISLFNLVHQVVLREAKNRALLVLQLRSFSGVNNEALADTDVMLAKLGIDTSEYPLLTGPLEEILENFGLVYEYVQGAPGTAGYDAAWNAQARYVALTQNKPFYVGWISPETRGSYRNQEENRQQRLKFSTVGITSSEIDVPLWLTKTSAEGPTNESVDFSHLEQFLRTKNVVSLKQFVNQHGAFTFERLIDINTGQAFLAIRQNSGYLSALLNLQTHSERQRKIAHGVVPTLMQAQQFVDDRVRWLLREAPR